MLSPRFAVSVYTGLFVAIGGAGVSSATATDLMPPGYPAALAPIASTSLTSTYQLSIQYTDSVIYDPVNERDDSVRLRTFQAPSGPTDFPYVGPTLEMKPGETLRLRIENNLPVDDPSCANHGGNMNIPHCFNTTNLHTHGLWISPSGNSDNVMISIAPGTKHEYEYNIPEDHPSGTFFYHPHNHGSTAIQVSSGLVGPIIVRGDRLPRLSSEGVRTSGDIDTLLKDKDGAPFAERVVLIQQIPYACRNGEEVIRTRDDETWWCDADDVGDIEYYDQFGQSTWDRSGRFNTLNGRVMPTFTEAESGSIERWRVIHGGVRDTVKMQFRKLKDGAQSIKPSAQSALDRQAYVDENCTGSDLPVLSIALDGLTRATARPQTSTILQPGYREDVLVLFPEPGTYCVIDGEIGPEESVSGRPQERALLGYVQVAGESIGKTQDVAAAMREFLVGAASEHMPVSVRQSIVNELQANLALTSFVDHTNIEDDELTGKQTLGFRYHNVNLDPDPPRYQHEVGYLGQDIGGKMILTNSQPYAPDRIDRTLTLGDVEEWTLASFWGGHPFHIHVNPFQIVSIKDQNGRDVSGPGSGQYADLKGTWKDTLFIEEGYVFKVRSRYKRYIGDFVLHCHILDHEDKGMMQNVRIVNP